MSGLSRGPAGALLSLAPGGGLVYGAAQALKKDDRPWGPAPIKLSAAEQREKRHLASLRDSEQHGMTRAEKNRMRELEAKAQTPDWAAYSKRTGKEPPAYAASTIPRRAGMPSNIAQERYAGHRDVGKLSGDPSHTVTPDGYGGLVEQPPAIMTRGGWKEVKSTPSTPSAQSSASAQASPSAQQLDQRIIYSRPDPPPMALLQRSQPRYRRSATGRYILDAPGKKRVLGRGKRSTILTSPQGDLGGGSDWDLRKPKLGG